MAEDTPKPSGSDPEPRPPGETASWQRTAELFAAALDQPAAGRLAWLLSRPDVDPGIREEVASLLEAFEKAGGFLDPDRIRLHREDDDPGKHD